MQSLKKEYILSKNVIVNSIQQISFRIQFYKKATYNLLIATNK